MSSEREKTREKAAWLEQQTLGIEVPWAGYRGSQAGQQLFRTQ